MRDYECYYTNLIFAWPPFYRKHFICCYSNWQELLIGWMTIMSLTLITHIHESKDKRSCILLRLVTISFRLKGNGDGRSVWKQVISPSFLCHQRKQSYSLRNKEQLPQLVWEPHDMLIMSMSPLGRTGHLLFGISEAPLSFQLSNITFWLLINDSFFPLH